MCRMLFNRAHLLASCTESTKLRTVHIPLAYRVTLFPFWFAYAGLLTVQVVGSPCHQY
jgi:hypothetical protein